MAGVYLHIPFCRQACYYCDFHFSTNRELSSPLVLAMAKEIGMQKNYLSSPVTTVYFGGGTPSLLDSSQLSLLTVALFDTFEIIPSAEITLEANPDDLSLEKLGAIKNLGINRLSIGLQSFDDTLLKYLHRAHTGEQGRQSVINARQSGFNNINIDLIYGIPGQGLEGWIEDIQKALDLQPEHISTYSLTIEQDTVFGRWKDKGKLTVIPDDEVAPYLETLMEMLGMAGYEQYEVSNFCRPGYHSIHNSSYWKQQPYLGIGPSAHSFNGVSRQFNIRNNPLYLRSIDNNVIPFELETLTKEDRINEYLLTTLRTQWGCDIDLLKKELGHDLLANSGKYIQTLLEGKLLEIHGPTLTLTKKGRMLADKISSDLFVFPA